MSNPWRWENAEQFCLSISLDRTPEEIIDIYGADVEKARQLPLNTAPSAPARGVALRAGSLGRWAFCIEFDNPIGCTERIMRDLSEHTESITLLRTAKALKTFHYAANGKVHEWFEPGYPPSVRGRSRYNFARKVHALTSAGADTISACSQVISLHIGQEITTETLEGPLLSAVVAEIDRAGLDHPDPPLRYPSSSLRSSGHLGRRL
ncbi:DUF6461 domain-containing protein [Streptomyces sp. NEAU-W12]|uniref:DUF6461 domain-containing protein n=1 Tax=Streptomyces sp. NEAU-W12 TaxID=2994668 RepID=UPI00224A806A|nr:DUF6461 domain-containing protein [Streptomyces sp. NEAU-W12]MCX2926113.1 DUF6461 domain-containing protein [Streptomyces sp. NEAU-W12]